jgi:hypothetical protein
MMTMEDDYVPPDMPDFDIEEQEHAMARPSAAHSAPGDVLGTPIRVDNNESGMLEFDTPVIEVRQGRQAAAKKHRGKVLDESTEISRSKMREWIMDPNSVKELLREPRTLPKTKAEAVKQQNVELLKKGKLIETLSREPLSGLMGPRLCEVLASMSAQSVRVQEPASSKKRKANVEPEKEAAAEDDDLRGIPDAQHDNVWDNPEMPDYDMPEMDMEPQQQQDEYEEIAAAPESARRGMLEDTVFDEYVRDVEEVDEEHGREADDDLQGRVTEQEERTKKVIVMLQKSFRQAENKTLHFHTMVQGSATETPSKHTAAVAFYELLGLHAKGFVKLEQEEAFGEISIHQTQLLMKKKA